MKEFQNINFGHLGNGIVVYDVNKEKNNDYKCIAFINPDRTIEYRDKKLSNEEIRLIVNYSLVKNPYTDMSHTNFVFKNQSVYFKEKEFEEYLNKEIIKYKRWANSLIKHYK